MSEVNLRYWKEDDLLPTAICRGCPWQELPEESQDCLNFKKLLCRLGPAAILERFFDSGIF